FSPDDRFVAVERHRRGADPEIVVVDGAAGTVHVVAARPKTRFVTPAWTPSGDAIVAAVAAGDEPFNLYEFPLNDPRSSRQLTHTPGGARWPDVSEDGRTLVFVGYSPDGYDIYSMPYPPRDPSVVSNVFTLPPAERPQDALAPPELDATPYSPLSTLKPT